MLDGGNRNTSLPHHLAPTAASSGWSFGDRGSFILNESERFNYHLEMGILITEMKLFCNEKWLEDLFHQWKKR